MSSLQTFSSLPPVPCGSGVLRWWGCGVRGDELGDVAEYGRVEVHVLPDPLEEFVVVAGAGSWHAVAEHIAAVAGLLVRSRVGGGVAGEAVEKGAEDDF